MFGRMPKAGILPGLRRSGRKAGRQEVNEVRVWNIFILRWWIRRGFLRR
jgi:hypothetical protein